MKDLNQGFIALFRQFTEWEWYDDANTMRLFIHCLLLANYKDKKWRGKLIKRGSFITSQSKLAHSLKLSIMQIRNSLKKLKTTGEITVYTTADYSVITVKNYNQYQDNNSLINRQITENEQASNRLITTTNNRNNIDNNIYNISSSSTDFEKFLKNLKKEEEEDLRNYSKKNKIKYFRPWLRKLYENGDIEDIKLKAKNYAECTKQKQAESCPPEKEEKPSPEDTKRGLELLRNTAAEIKRRRTK